MVWGIKDENRPGRNFRSPQTHRWTCSDHSCKWYWYWVNTISVANSRPQPNSPAIHCDRTQFWRNFPPQLSFQFSTDPPRALKVEMESCKTKIPRLGKRNAQCSFNTCMANSNCFQPAHCLFHRQWGFDFIFGQGTPYQQRTKALVCIFELVLAQSFASSRNEKRMLWFALRKCLWSTQKLRFWRSGERNLRENGFMTGLSLEKNFGFIRQTSSDFWRLLKFWVPRTLANG